MELTTADLESRLTLLFSTMEARKAAIRREREDRKLSAARYWWQDEQETQTTKHAKYETPTNHARTMASQTRRHCLF